MLVSVIVPFYKGNKYICDLCSSIEKNAQYLNENQSDCFIECIIVNDSPDVNVILPDNDFHFKIQVVYHEKNAGIQQARVTGLKFAKGDYIVFLDQDDELLEHAIFEEISYISDYDLLIGNAWIENELKQRNILYKTKGSKKNVLSLGAYIYGHNRIISPGHCLIRRESIPLEWKKFIMDVNGSDDLFLWVLMFSKNARIQFMDKVVYVHKYTGNNLSAEENKMSVSSFSMGEYLDKVSYVNKKTIYILKKSRAFAIDYSKCSIGKKILFVFKNIDIIVGRIYFKIRDIF